LPPDVLRFLGDPPDIVGFIRAVVESAGEILAHPFLEFQGSEAQLANDPFGVLGGPNHDPATTQARRSSRESS
jgi:hypothetical protein